MVMFRGFFLPGWPTGLDLGTHYYLSVEKYSLLQETGFRDGLLHQWYLGFSPYAYYPDLFYLVFSASKALFTPLIADIDIYKLLLVGVFYLPICGAYALSFTLSGSVLFSLVAAVLVVSVSVFSGAGIQGHFQIGLINQTLGMGLYLYFLTFFLQWRDKGGWRLGMKVLCIFLLIVQAHIITLAVTFLTLAILLPWFYFTSVRPYRCQYAREDWVKMAAVGFPAVVCLGSLAFRIVRYWGEQGARTGWGDIDLLQQSMSGSIFSTGFVNASVVVIIIAALLLERFRHRTLALVVVCALLLFLGTGFVRFGGMLDIFNSVFRHRAFGFAGVVAMVLASVALFQLWQSSGTMPSTSRKVSRWGLVGLVSALVISAMSKSYEESDTIRVSSSLQAPQGDSYLRIADRIRLETPQESVILYQLNGDNGHDAPFVYLASSLAVFSQRTLVQGHQVESSRLNFDDDIARLNHASESEICTLFERTGATHILAWSPPALSRFAQASCLMEVMSEGHFHLFSYRNATFSRMIGNVRVSSFFHSRHRYAWVVHSELEKNLLFLGLSYHPRFSAEINGKSTQIERSERNLIGITVGRGESLIVLEYRLPYSEFALGMLEMFITALALVFLFVEHFVVHKSDDL
ncbi:hypothetical protein [Candidatus Symbiobacter mobilis]|uniref:Uncharacterized protein n=1 Tax=Candidatus Symbiobacter mobilis CR TaxID=946483 RepID=U5NA17_9BURK|nr:hypothetical protein [Candidatus Symbiobacter mobilis]AGX88165.1 hypothetical protein Cenrod_2094 [Candidatus Symbiobacter mobilis CR]